MLLAGLALCGLMVWRLVKQVYAGVWAVEVDEGVDAEAAEDEVNKLAAAAAGAAVAGAGGGGSAAAEGQCAPPGSEGGAAAAAAGTMVPPRSPHAPAAAGGGAGGAAAAAASAPAVAAMGTSPAAVAAAAGAAAAGPSASKGQFRKQGVITVVRRLHADYTSGALEAQGLAVQNGLDAVASAMERLLALVTGLDVIASSIFYFWLLVVSVAIARFGLGPVVFTAVLLLLRPPFLRRVPGVIGALPFVSNLPVRSIEHLSA